MVMVIYRVLYLIVGSKMGIVKDKIMYYNRLVIVTWVWSQTRFCMYLLD